MSARIVLTLTDLGDLLSWCSNLRFPPLGVSVLAVMAFWIGCGLLALQAAMPMVDFLPDVGCNRSRSSSVPKIQRMASMER